MKSYAPIVLFTYNRPEHTKRTLEALAQNIGAEDSILVIYSDAPKKEKDADKVQKVRDYLHTVDGFKETHVIEREKNMGLADSIIDGVTRATEEFGRVIVLEDDIVTSPYFLDYMNTALEKYKDEEQVMAISGYLQPIASEDLPETFFLPWFDCWGWAVWKRSWQYFERDPEKLLRETSQDEIRYYNVNGTDDKWKQVIDNAEKRIRTWAVFFYIAICKHHGLVLHCNTSLVSNEGLDGSGEDSGISYEKRTESVYNKKVTQYSEDYTVNEEAERRLEEYYRTIHDLPPLYTRLIKIFRQEGLQGIIKRIRLAIKYNLKDA